jgi:hypothetical protein
MKYADIIYANKRVRLQLDKESINNGSDIPLRCRPYMHTMATLFRTV